MHWQLGTSSWKSGRRVRVASSRLSRSQVLSLPFLSTSLHPNLQRTLVRRLLPHSMCVLSHHSIICQGRLRLANDKESGVTSPATDHTAAFVFLCNARPHCATGRAGAAEIKVMYPQLAAMVSYIQDRHSALKQAAATGRGSLDMTKPLPLQPKAYLALISFLRECRKQNRNDSRSPSQSYLGNQSPS